MQELSSGHALAPSRNLGRMEIDVFFFTNKETIVFPCFSTNNYQEIHLHCNSPRPRMAVKSEDVKGFSAKDVINPGGESYWVEG